MDLELNPDQRLLAETLGKWAEGHGAIAPADRALAWLDGRAQAAELREQGFLDACRIPELGLVGAVVLIDAVCRVPHAVEIGASGLVAPALGLEPAGAPLATMQAGGNRVARFLAEGGSLLVDCGDHLRLAEGLAGADAGAGVEPVAAPYAYPVGRLNADPAGLGERLDGLCVNRFRRLLALAQAAEAVSAMEAALALAIDHVTSRVQFGRPIGSFQAVQHRLGECSAVVMAARWLIYRAACEDAQGEAVAQAAIVTHDAMRRVLYDTTQFHGALGLTLEYPLHLWTYRLRALQGDMAQAAAEASR